MAKVIALELDESNHAFIVHEWRSKAAFNASQSWIDDRWYQVVVSSDFNDDPDAIFELIDRLSQNPTDERLLVELTAKRLLAAGFSKQLVASSNPIPRKLCSADREDSRYLAWLHENEAIDRKNVLARKRRDESREARRLDLEAYPLVDKLKLLNGLELQLAKSEQQVSNSVARADFASAIKQQESITVLEGIIADIKDGKYNAD